MRGGGGGRKEVLKKRRSSIPIGIRIIIESMLSSRRHGVSKPRLLLFCVCEHTQYMNTCIPTEGGEGKKKEVNFNALQ